jgi:hypothetical protein
MIFVPPLNWFSGGVLRLESGNFANGYVDLRLLAAAIRCSG